MKKTTFYLILLLGASIITSCTRPVRHDDPFYNINRDDYPLSHLPLIKPTEATRQRSSSPWRISSSYGPWVSKPKSQEVYFYTIEELEKFAVENGIVMAYSSYVDKEADGYIQNDYYHWFVLIPDKKIAEGFHTEDEFTRHIQALGIANIKWQSPDDAYDVFMRTGCLEWFPDCN